MKTAKKMNILAAEGACLVCGKQGKRASLRQTNLRRGIKPDFANKIVKVCKCMQPTIASPAKPERLQIKKYVYTDRRAIARLRILRGHG
jgi:hypothetical protein